MSALTVPVRAAEDATPRPVPWQEIAVDAPEVRPQTQLDDAQFVARQRQELKLTFPVAAGQGLRVSYGVDATPKMVLLDSAGIVQGGYVGWGPETPQLIAEELKRCPKTTPASPEDVGKPKVTGKASPVNQFGQRNP